MKRLSGKGSNRKGLRKFKGRLGMGRTTMSSDENPNRKLLVQFIVLLVADCYKKDNEPKKNDNTNKLSETKRILSLLKQKGIIPTFIYGVNSIAFVTILVNIITQFKTEFFSTY